MFLESIGLMGLMGLTNDEKWDFIKSSSLDLLSSIVSVEEKLFDDYLSRRLLYLLQKKVDNFA